VSALIRGGFVTASKRLRFRILACLVLFLSLAEARWVVAQTDAAPTLIPREVLFGNPERVRPHISPDGTRMAWIAPDKKNVLQVWVQTVGKDDAKAVTADKKRGIRQFFWIWNDEDLLYLQDNDGDENFQIFITNLKTGETRNMTPIFGTRAFPAEISPLFPNEILVALNRRDKSLFDIWKLDVQSGALTMAAENPGGVGDWAIDSAMKVRGASFLTPDGGGEFKVRDTESAPWKTLTTWGVTDSVNLYGFSKDGQSAYVQTNKGTDTQGLYSIDTATGKMTLLASDPGVDASDVVIHPLTKQVQAVAFNRDRTRWKVLDPTVAADFEALAKAAPGDLALINRDRKDQIWLVSFSSDVSPARYYTWDRTTRKATYLFSARPALEKYTLASMKPVEIPARDGWKLPSYLTLPAGAPPKKLPMVLFVHGGPWARDGWGYDPYAQWLANRGYAVLQVNYRGSEGFGKMFKNGAMKQFAGKMHDDLVDAVRWAVAQGTVDPKRIAIMGGSYGGYATLVGVTFTPELFSCGVDIVGPSNLVTLVESFPPYWGPYLSSSWYPFVGNPKDQKDRADMESRSPLFKADRIRVPLLIGQGANDPRVTQKESEQIVSAIEKNGGKVTYVVYSDEGHGFARPENRVDFYARAEKFLAEYLGGRYEPMLEDKMAGSTAAVRVVGGTATPAAR
jgi:dipeptidyl aminopeptidase/acylaminoacyl peptidase